MSTSERDEDEDEDEGEEAEDEDSGPIPADDYIQRNKKRVRSFITKKIHL